MTSRYLGTIRSLVTVIAIVVPGSAASTAGQATVPASKTTSPAKTKAWTPPHTAWGDPDLQGVWSNATRTPLQRPTQFAEKQVLSAEEAAALDAQAEANSDRPPRPGDTGTYNRFWAEGGKWSTRTALIVDPPSGTLPPLSPEGQKREKAQDLRGGNGFSSGSGPFNSVEDIGIVTRCITRGLPNAMLPGPYNNNYEIVQAPGFVVLFSEMMHDTRVIPLDRRPHISQNMRQWMGDSRGHWEGNTLVVDVTNFPDRDVTGFGLAYRYAESPDLHLIERFTRVGPDTINYEVTVEDPMTFTRPWTASIPMAKSDELTYEYACHEGNYSIVNMLRGARAEEKPSAESAQNGLR